MSALKQARKYLYILSAFFVIISLVHLSIIYLYDGSKVNPEHGGNISIGLIGSLPNMNPVQFRMDPGNDFTLRFLYRSLLRYDTDTRTMQGDLANCDLGKNFSEIRCFFKSGSKWSDGTSITKEDVLATYNLLSENDSNQTLSAALGKMDIAEENGAIVFRTNTPNVDLLDVFTVPIIRQDVAKKLETTTPKSEEMVYSGPYMFEKHESDLLHSAEKISLVENPNYTEAKPFISRYTLRFFNDKNSLLAMKDSLHFIYPNKEIDENPSARFAEMNVLLPQNVMLFANTGKLPSALRSFVLFQIGNSKIMDDVAKYGKIVHNPFGGDDTTIPTLDEPNTEVALGKMGFFHPANLEKELSKAQEKKVVTPSTSLSYFNSPSKSKTVVAGESNDILLSGSVPDGVDAVYINGYKLQGFKKGSKEFFYRARTEMGNLKEGTNTYTLAFLEGGKQNNKETMTIFFIADATAREAKKAEVAKNIAAATTEAAEKAAAASKINDELKQKIAGLFADKYYDKSLKELSVHMSYMGGSDDLKELAYTISKTLEASGIKCELKELQNADMIAIKKGEKNYDLLLTGADLGLLGYNIFPYFHSGQAETGYNYSKIKNQNLDVLLEQLKSSDTGKSGFQQTREKILSILKKEAVVITFYSPKYPLYIDRSIRGIKAIETVPYFSYSYDLLEKIFINEDRVADFSQKTFQGFTSWFKGLFSQS